MAGEAKINELMKEFAVDAARKPHMRDIAPMVPKIIKALTKVSGDRKANMVKISQGDEKATVACAACFYKDRFNAEIQVYSESDAEKFDPKGRAAMAMPYQPAIYIE
jgi:leucyl-tRNA synthetase